jgi:hypothetical protein
LRQRSRVRQLAAALAASALATGAAAQSVDPGAKIPAGDSASEYWDLVATLDDGFVVTARFAITNEGPGEHNALAFGHVLRPGSPPVPFQNGRRRGAWRLSPDRRRIEIGSSLLALPDGARHFEVDNDKRGVKVFLDWQPDASGRTAPVGPQGYQIDVLQLASPVRASVWIVGMKSPKEVAGTLSLIHTRVPVQEGELILRRIDVVSREPGSGAHLLDLLAPDGARFSWLSVASTPGAELLERSGFAVGTEGEVQGASPGHPNPSRLSLKGADLRGTVSLGEPFLEVDPLAALPGFLRMVYSLRGRPHRSWTPAHFDLSLIPGPALPAIRVAGDAIAALTFLDTLPQSQRAP